MELAERLRATLVLLDELSVEHSSDTATLNATPLSLRLEDAGAALAHAGRKLSLLSLTAELPSWDSGEGAALADETERAAAAVVSLAVARGGGGCSALRSALCSGASQAVQAAARLAASLPPPGEAVAAHRAAVTAATAAASEAAEALARLPRDNRAATGRALVAAGARVKDAAREARGMSEPVAFGADDDDSESCDYDESATPSEARIITAAEPLLAACLACLAPLLRCVSAGSSAVPAAVLDDCLQRYCALASVVEDFTAALWPPQERELLRQHARGAAAAAAALPAAAVASAAGGLDEVQAAALASAVAVVDAAALAVVVLLDSESEE